MPTRPAVPTMVCLAVVSVCVLTVLSFPRAGGSVAAPTLEVDRSGNDFYDDPDERNRTTPRPAPPSAAAPQYSVLDERLAWSVERPIRFVHLPKAILHPDSCLRRES